MHTVTRASAFAGITWLLSDEVMAMGPSAWAARYAQLADIRSRPPKRAYVAQTHPDSGLRDWLTHQKALKQLGATFHPMHLYMVASAR